MEALQRAVEQWEHEHTLKNALEVLRQVLNFYATWDRKVPFTYEINVLIEKALVAITFVKHQDNPKFYETVLSFPVTSETQHYQQLQTALENWEADNSPLKALVVLVALLSIQFDLSEIYTLPEELTLLLARCVSPLTFLQTQYSNVLLLALDFAITNSSQEASL